MDDTLITFANGKFTHEIRKCVMDLVSLNVSMTKVSDVMRTVLSNLTKYDTDNMRLPSAGARQQFLQEAHFLADYQVAQEMLSGQIDFAKDGNCLHGDGTTKYSRHYENFQVTTKSGKALSLGLHEVVNSDSDSLMKTFIETIHDVCDVMQGDKEYNEASLVASFKTTMSDMAPVNPLFHEN